MQDMLRIAPTNVQSEIPLGVNDFHQICLFERSPFINAPFTFFQWRRICGFICVSTPFLFSNEKIEIIEIDEASES